MPKRYNKLRGYLKMYGYEQPEVAERLGRGVSYVSRCYTGKNPWQQDEMYALMDMIERPYSELHEIFPPNGIEQKGERHDQTNLPRMWYKLVRIRRTAYMDMQRMQQRVRRGTERDSGERNGGTKMMELLIGFTVITAFITLCALVADKL